MMNKMPILYRVGRFILGPIFKWYYKPTIIGKENIPASGAILIVGNHKHLYDQCLSIISTKRYIRYMAKKEYFDNKKTRWFFSSVGCISVDRQNNVNGIFFLHTLFGLFNLALSFIDTTEIIQTFIVNSVPDMTC